MNDGGSGDYDFRILTGNAEVSVWNGDLAEERAKVKETVFGVKLFENCPLEDRYEAYKNQ